MEIRDYTPGDETAIVELFEIAFRKPMTLDYWIWRFKDNPAGNLMIKLMWHDGILVGHYAVSPTILYKNGSEVLSALSMTTMTHPDYSGLGIFPQLSKAVYETYQHLIQAVWGFPNNNSHRGLIQNLNWKNITALPMLSCSVSSIKPALNPDFKPVNLFTDAHSEAHSRLFSDYKIRVKKDARYLNWRYLQNPINNYTVLELSDRHDGFVVCKEFINSQGRKELDIVEWCIDKDEKICRSVIKHLATIFPSSSFERFNIWIPLNDERHLYFEKLGFICSTPVTYFAVTSLNNEVFNYETDWWIQLGDSDVY